jgi:hypothetical protein
VVMNRRDFVTAAAAIPVAAALAPAARGQTVSSPLSLPLVTASTPLFNYLGSFNIPSAFQYGGSGMSVSGSTLYVSGLQQSSASLGAMTIPAIGGSASLVKSPVSFSPSGINRACGSLLYNNKLYVTIALGYDVGPLNVFMVTANPDMSGISAPCSAKGSAGSMSRMFSNSMGLVPSLWQPILGGPAFVAGGAGGMVGLSIISNMCCGFGFSTFDPAAVVGGSSVALNEWLNYPYSDPASAGTALWSRTPKNSKGGDDFASIYDGPLGCAFIAPGSRSLLFISVHCYGPSGSRGSSPCDPSGQASGSNETPSGGDIAAYRRVQVTAYDLAAIVNNRNAGKPVSAVLPYAFWELPGWQPLFVGGGGASMTCVQQGQVGNSWMAFDGQRLYAALEGNLYGLKIGVWSVAGSATSPPPPVPDSPKLSVT